MESETTKAGSPPSYKGDGVAVWVNTTKDGKDVFEYDIFNCPQNLKGQLKIGDFS